jgi:hypothetical protein
LPVTVPSARDGAVQSQCRNTPVQPAQSRSNASDAFRASDGEMMQTTEIVTYGSILCVAWSSNRELPTSQFQAASSRKAELYDLENDVETVINNWTEQDGATVIDSFSIQRRGGRAVNSGEPDVGLRPCSRSS